MDKLLIIDDEDAMRRVLRLNLGDSYDIVDTGDPTDAVALALQERPNAILLDLRMPQYSGYELCRTFRAITATQLMPIIIVSGETGPAVAALCTHLGATAFFPKPVDYEALRSYLSELLQASRPERRAERRVQLRVPLKLQGTDANGQPFEEWSATENVSARSVLCGCAAPLKMDSTVEVHLATGNPHLVGTARVVRAEESKTRYPRFGFRFLEKVGDWILQ